MSNQTNTPSVPTKRYAKLTHAQKKRIDAAYRTLKEIHSDSYMELEETLNDIFTEVENEFDVDDARNAMLQNINDFESCLSDNIIDEVTCQDGDIDEDEIVYLMQNKLFIVGSGTWQSVFDESPGKSDSKPGIGFLPEHHSPETGSRVDTSKIYDSELIPKELLARFNNPVQIMEYPAREEIKSLVSRSGLQGIATKYGVTIDFDRLASKIQKCGFRAFEDLRTEIEMKNRKFSRDPIAKDPPSHA